MGKWDSAFDYVIVGAGSAGCVLANRLSEDGGNTVLLLEAGPADKQREIHIPAAFGKLFKTELDWNYRTEREPHLDNRRIYWPRGKVLGGSSSINAMIYMRGQPQDYDGWAQLGNVGWSWDDVLVYFKKSERQERGDSHFHGSGGPLNVADQRDAHDLSRAFVKAAVQAGYPANNDFNGERQEGFGLFQVNQRKGQRHSAAAAYLAPVKDRPNLTVETGAHVQRVVFEGGRATGVAYARDGSEWTAAARREVLLSGGSVNSPQLLMRSGVGPAEHLGEMGIEVVADLSAVGENLQDHPAVPIAYRCTQPVTLIKAESLSSIGRFLLFRRGMLTSNVAEAGGFVRSRPELDRPDIQFHFAPVYYLEHGFHTPPGHGFTLGPLVLQPKSRGRIRLRSSDPLEAPAIHANYLSDEGDLNTLLEGLKIGRRIAAMDALAPYRGEEYVPGGLVQDDNGLVGWLREATETLYHPAGTCKMGVDEMAVVDPQLRVRGVDALRVVDASVMPTLVSGNPNAPVMMIAEKAADLIKATDQTVMTA